MCEAHDWRRIGSAACLLCFLLCVLLNVHVHAAGAASTAPPTAAATAHASHRSNESRKHLGVLMVKYGGGGSEGGGGSGSAGAALVMTAQGLASLMDQIGLGHEGHDHSSDAGHANATAVGNDTAKCLSAQEMHGWYHGDSRQKGLNEAEFQDLCPTLVYLLDAKTCSRAAVGKDAKKVVKALPQYWKIWSGDPHVLKVWGASLLAVFVTSLGGVATIFLIRPLMQTRFYTLVVQFLIALAVGSLSGDAFLHLMPHALFPSDEGHESHDHGEGSETQDHMQTLYRCLTALAGIYCFFVIERITVLCQNQRHRNRNANNSRRPQANSSNVGEKLCNPFHRSYANLTGGAKPDVTVVCDVADDMTLEFLHPDGCNSAATTAVSINGNCALQRHPKSHHHIDLQLRPQHQPASVRVKSSSSDVDQSELTSLSTTPLTQQPGGPGHPLTPGDTAAETSATPSTTVATGEGRVTFDDGEDFEPHHHHHGHSHAHTTVRALAWTVIIGDGLHNFCDGMALGAAFAADLQSGLSTAVAVFCHELPHELGDFAVLLQAGMSVRMALLANLVSSVVCLFGMVAGVLLVQRSTHWVFMATAGMFLYIALVDMMPELTTEKSSRGPGPCSVFICQNVGFFIGAGIMMLISLYEHKIIKL